MSTRGLTLKWRTEPQHCSSAVEFADEGVFGNISVTTSTHGPAKPHARAQNEAAPYTSDVSPTHLFNRPMTGGPISTFAKRLPPGTGEVAYAMLETG